MPAYSQLTHLLAARLEPGERELSNQDLRQIFGLEQISDEVRGQIADDLRDAGVEVLGLEPLLVRKAAPPPVEAPEPEPPSRRPWLYGAGALALLLALVVLIPTGRGPRAVTAMPAPPATHAHSAAPAGTPKPDTGKRITPVEIARPGKTAKRPPRCSRRLRSKCEPRARAGRRARRGR